MARPSPWKDRTRWSAEEARAIIGEQERSGLSVWRFAERHGLVAERLYRWRRKLRPEKAPGRRKRRLETAPVQFVEVQTAGGLAPIEIALRGGHRVLVRGPVDVDALRAIVAALEQPC
jgi:transposase-like protein